MTYVTLSLALLSADVFPFLARWFDNAQILQTGIEESAI